MEIKEGLKYSQEHEWVKITEDKAYIGITDFAQDSLGDIVFVELPEIGSDVVAGETFGVVESVKAASDLFSPVSGVVSKINEDLNDSPEVINEDPYSAWIIEVKLSDLSELDNLMNQEEYLDFCSKEG